MLHVCSTCYTLVDYCRWATAMPRRRASLVMLASGWGSISTGTKGIIFSKSGTRACKHNEGRP